MDDAQLRGCHGVPGGPLCGCHSVDRAANGKTIRFPPDTPYFRFMVIRRDFPHRCELDPAVRAVKPASSFGCGAGMNGRCFLNGDPCRTLCSYDDCLTDTDCPSGQPCTCRASGTETTANRCVVGSTCATDANCGECGFCSLSVQHTVLQCSPPSDAGARKCACEGVTSEAYACHSVNDECTDDSDCPGVGGYCAYVDAEKRWACTACKSNGFR